ncbi:MAG TPA: hypothetical protein DEG17_11955, partial [Cyanobacteria bacterium UBA11149]|nr:hypothetical protein [Cyanobacteria bacterium UBA11367]HBW89560.1 hypothetical protein [Cyanobacteria bacterium UBA11149]
MRSQFHHLSLFTATLILSLTFPLQLSGISSAIAAQSERDAQFETKIPDFSKKSGILAAANLQQLHKKTFQIAGGGITIPSPPESTIPSAIELRQKLDNLQEILTTQRQNRDRTGEADTLNKMGLIRVQLKESDKALELHQQALAIYEALSNRQSEAETLGYIGNAYFKAGKYQEVEDLFRQKLDSLRKNSNPEREKLILEVMSRYLEEKWQFHAAFGVAKDMYLRRAQARGDISWQEQLEISKLNLFISKEIRDIQAQEHSFHSIGWVYRNLGRYSQALESYQQALAIARERNIKDHEVFLIIELGLVYNDLAQYNKALELLERALSIMPNLQESGELVVPLDYLKPFALNQIGLIYHKLKQDERALHFFEEALLQPGFESSNILNNIGLIYLEIGEYGKALKAYQDALQSGNSGDPRARILPINNIGLVYTQTGDYSKALETYRKALTLFRELNDRPGERLTLSNIGILLERQQKPELAIVFYKEAVNISEKIREDLNTLTIEEQKSYTETVADTYRRLADLLLSQGRILEGQQVLELLKVQELRNFTRDTRAGGENSGISTNPTETEILKIHGSLIALGQKIENCQGCAERSQLLDQRDIIAKEFEDTVRSLEQEIRARNTNDKAFLDPTTLTSNAEEIVSAQPGTVLIYPLVLEEKLWILWAAQGGITKTIEVPNVGLKELSETVVKFRQMLRSPGYSIREVQKTAKQLHDWLMPESLAKELKENKIQNLVFSLARVTRYLPMSALFDGEKYLIENYNISTIISANLTKMGDRLPPGTEKTSVLALGLSDAVGEFNPLPNVPQELDAIVKESPTDSQGIYPGLSLLNKAFNYQALRDNLAGHLILHIATHGEFVPGSAYDSYLLLGNGEKLPIPDIQKLRDLSKIHLVVLSACETALGDRGQDGSEIAGLSYYFLNGGAKAVMASLWRVDDESTRLLMEYFYRNLAKSTVDSPITKAEALRQAQLSLIKGTQINENNRDSRSLGLVPREDVVTSVGENGTEVPTTNGRFAHPYYWGSFILIG